MQKVMEIMGGRGSKGSELILRIAAGSSEDSEEGAATGLELERDLAQAENEARELYKFLVNTMSARHFLPLLRCFVEDAKKYPGILQQEMGRGDGN